MNPIEENVRYQIESLKKNKVIIYWTASLSFIILVLGIVLKSIYFVENKYIISKSADSILFELTILVSGSFFTSSLIGVVYEKYQSRIVKDDTLLRRRFVDEGIMRVYESATDPELISFLLNEIKNSKSEVVAVGMGLGILAHNPKIVQAISEKCIKEQNYRFKVVLGDPNNDGVKNRIKEEKETLTLKGLNYDETWVNRYPSEIKGLLKNYIPRERNKSYSILCSPTCPLISAIKIDNNYLYFSYGTPDIKGSQSPWILVNGETENGALSNFLRRIFVYYDDK